MEDFEYEQLEKIVKYELMGTDDKEIISKFIEKIKNREESENIMMNAARIINKEIRKQRREGREEGREEGSRGSGREERRRKRRYPKQLSSFPPIRYR